MVVFSSDNGPETSWKQRIEDFQHFSSGPYRGGKRDIYEGGHRVPFFVRWPAGIKQPGRTWSGLVCQTDLLATLADVLDEKLPDNSGEDSQSFKSVLSDPQSRHSRLPLISHAANGRFAITDGHWKMVLPHRKSESELYDLLTDPGESKNVIVAEPDVAATLQQKITDIVCNGRTTRGPIVSNETGHWPDLAWFTSEEYAKRAQAK
jgi:arylsulfatase A